MAFLGLMSLIQIWIIPGYLLLYKTQGISRIDKLLLAIPLSATINFFIIYLLVALGSYTQLVILSLFITELIALLMFIRSATKFNVQQTLSKYLEFKFERNATTVIYGILVFIIAAQSFDQVGTVFTICDAYASWNPWGISWFNGVIPTGIAWYPQLLPTLYSLTYQFIGNTGIEIFAKIAVSFYPLFALAIIARVAFLFPSERNKILWAGIIFFLLVRRLWGATGTINGYADFPLAFLCISILYVFALKATNKTIKSNSLAFILIGIAIAAGLMKQPGVYLGILVPFFWLAYFRAERNWNKHFIESALIGVAIAAGYATWYLFQYWRITKGIDSSNLSVLSSIVKLTWYESIIYGFKGLAYKLSWLWAVLFIAAFANHKVRYLALFGVLPLLLLWAAFVPYDYRNIAVIVPLLALSLAYGWVEIRNYAGKLFPENVSAQNFSNMFTFILLAVFVSALANPKLENDLLKLSNEEKKQIGDPQLNNLLITYYKLNPESSLIATPFIEIGKIPQLSERYKYFFCEYDSSTSSEIIHSALVGIEDGATRHVLLTPQCNKRVDEFYLSQPNKYRLIFRHEGTAFYKILGREAAIK